jgi:hypothetical protein
MTHGDNCSIWIANLEWSRNELNAGCENGTPLFRPIFGIESATLEGGKDTKRFNETKLPSYKSVPVTTNIKVEPAEPPRPPRPADQ